METKVTRQGGYPSWPPVRGVAPLRLCAISAYRLICFVFLALAAALASGGSLSASQMSALKKIYDTTGGPNWRLAPGRGKAWSFAASSSDPCVSGWYGVECSSGTATATVSRLSLNSSSLQGTIPSEIGLLTGLQSLVLDTNNLDGAIPSEMRLLQALTMLKIAKNSLVGTLTSALGQMTALRAIILYGNNLELQIPSALGQITGLRRLDLSMNAFTGPIPTSLSLLKSLEILDLSSNQLKSSIPSVLGKMLSLHKLSLFSNSFEQQLPSSLGQLLDLTMLWISSCYLTGTIPSALGKLSKLTFFDLSGNQLDGNLPTFLGLLANLETLWLSTNSFDGRIPSELGQLQYIQFMYLFDNKLTGGIPSELGKLGRLKVLALNENILSSSIPASFVNLTSIQVLELQVNVITGSIPSFLVSLKQLETLDLSINSFSSKSLPSELGLLTSLRQLDVSDNLIGGTIPSTLGQLIFLEALGLSKNLFSSSIPAVLGHLTNLKALWLNNNMLTSSIPSALYKLANLHTLNLYSNALTSSISTEIGLLTGMTFLDLSLNKLTSSAPSELGNLSKLRSLWLNGNRLTGKIPRALAKLGSLATLVLSSNALDSVIPSEVGEMTALTTLWLSRNQLTGSIPPTIGRLTALRSIYLFDNKLSGPVVSELGKLTKLQTIDFTRNRLSSTIPPLGDLADLHHLSLANNRLTGEVIPTSFGKLSMLQSLDVSHNLLAGTGLSTFEFGRLSSSLVSLRIGSNSLGGSLPLNMSSLKSLKEFVCADNDFSGSLNVLASLPSLISFNVSSNRFSGSIPSGLGRLTHLTYVDAANNHFTGSLPTQLASLLRLEVLDISANGLSGVYPRELCLLSSLIAIDLSHNQLSRAPPRCISSMSNLSLLSLAANLFTGSLDFLVGAPNLVTVDVSGNAFQSSIPAAIFETTTLRTFAAASNCLSGQIPAAVCRATALETLVLDGLSAGSSCRVPIFSTDSVFKFTGSKLLNKIQGTLPACLFTSLPRIVTLHLAGNGLTGNGWASIEAWPQNLTDLSVSHNRLSGEMSVSLQRGLAQFHRFDASFNRFGGMLGAVRLAGGTQLNLRVNRYSGLLSPSVISASQVQVLEGNLFACPRGAAQLPASDPYLSHFRCGSDDFNDFMIIFAVLIAVVSLLQLWLLRSQSRLSMLQSLRDWLDPVLVEASECDVSSSVSTILSSLRAVRRFAAMFGVLLLVVLLPIYGTTSSLQGTHAELYAWAVSAGFKSGVGSAGVFLVSWVLLLSTMHWHLVSQYRRAAFTVVSASQRELPLMADSRLKLKLRVILFGRIACIFLINLFCVLLPNVGYVVVIGSRSLSVQITTGLALSVYKMVWNALGIPSLLSNRHLMFGVSEAEVETHELNAWLGGFFYELLLRGFNSVIVPTVALLAIDSNCFSQAFIAPPPVQSSYSFESFSIQISYYVTTYLDGSSKTSLESSTMNSQQTHLISFEPAFQYGFQCSAVLLQVYVPVFLLMALVSSFGEPLVQSGVRCAILKMDPALQSKIRSHWLWLKILPLLDRWRKVSIKSEVRQKYQVLDTHALFMPVLQDLLILMSFGLVAPLLGLVVVVSLISRTLRWHRLIVDFVSSEEARSSGGVDALAKDCRELSERAHPLFSVRWFLVAFSAIFLVFFLIDSAGDAVGIKASLWAPLLMQLLPLLLGILLERRLLPLASASASESAATPGAVPVVAPAAASGGAAPRATMEMSTVYHSARSSNFTILGAQAALATIKESSSSGALSAAVLQDLIPSALNHRSPSPSPSPPNDPAPTSQSSNPLHIPNTPARLSPNSP